MPNDSPRIPAYRLHKPTGQAVVRLDGRDRYLGRHGTEASREKYRRTVAEWLAAPARPPDAGPAPSDPAAPVLSVSGLILAYMTFAEVHYRGPDGQPTREVDNMRDALRPVQRLYGSTDVRAFGPLALRAVQGEMVAAGLSRGVVNSRVNRIRRAFKWAVGMELLSPSVHQALTAVPGLQRGRTAAPESPGVKPVPPEVVEATLPHLAAPAAAMVRVQLLTGCRPGEVVVMRGRDIKPGEPNATYRPAAHKTAWRGRERSILIGPRAMEVLRPFLKADPDAYLFDPREAFEEQRVRRVERGKIHRTPRQLAAGRKRSKVRQPGACYSVHSYHRAVERACRKAFPHPTISSIAPKDRTAEQAAALVAWDRSHAWKPLQLRHTAATTIRARYGLEAAQTILGHARADVTQIYAERDLAKAGAVVAEAG